jgi:hypothetical protein
LLNKPLEAVACEHMMLCAACPPDLVKDCLEETTLHYRRACCGGASTNARRKLHALLAAVCFKE